MSNENTPYHNDIVLIRGLSLAASIGVFDWEKKIKQTLVFDLDLTCDFSKASVTDDIKDAVNYSLVCEVIEKVLHSKHYQLLEYLAEKICSQLFDSFQISSIKLTVYKPEAVKNAQSVGVSIYRQHQKANRLFPESPDCE